MTNTDSNTARQGLTLAKCSRCSIVQPVPGVAQNHRKDGGRWMRPQFDERGKIVDWR